jgi:23S rRNA (cytidine1920-2'-O)/16S rRNA (cytidine1409-2'-O)-methyltransferase
MVRVRVDKWLVEHGLAPSREQAVQLIAQGCVYRQGQPISKPTTWISESDRVEVRSLNSKAYVGRGGLKLEGAIQDLHIEVPRETVLDVGSSTGGFTDFLLRSGASRVIAVDVGTHQMHEKLRGHPQVEVLENTHILKLTQLPGEDPVHFAVADVSFISLRKVLKHVWQLLTPPRKCLLLFKPQFEVGVQHVRRGGVVRDPQIISSSLGDFLAFARETLGALQIQTCLSRMKGKKKGNQEVWVWLQESV